MEKTWDEYLEQARKGLGITKKERKPRTKKRGTTWTTIMESTVYFLKQF